MIDFTKDQKKAIEKNDANLRIIACAGSGKTSTVAGKVMHLLNPKNNFNVEPKNIIAFTYTEKAAGELKNKILKFIKETPELEEIKGMADMYIGTIHGWCLKALQDNEYEFQKYSVLDEIKLKLFVDKNYYKIGMSEIRKLAAPHDSMRIFVDTKRFIQIMNIIRESELLAKLPSDIENALDKYETILKQNCYFDFTMIMTEALKHLIPGNPLFDKIKNELKYLIVDEYQDINPIQEKLINKLYEVSKAKLTVVGDDDQNIYQWRGSNNFYIQNFLKAYSPATEQILNENFRSSKGITTLAESVVSVNQRLSKKMISAEKQTFIKNEDVLYNEFQTINEENTFIAHTINNLIGIPFTKDGKTRGLDYSDFAILLRTWSKTEDIAAILDRHNIPYITAGVNQLFSVPEVKAAVGIFELLNNQLQPGDLQDLWASIPHSSINVKKLQAAIKELDDEVPEKSIDKKGNPIWAYNLQQIYWDFLEQAEINENSFSNSRRAEIIMFNLGKFSQVVNDFEEVNFNSVLPVRHLKNFLDFVTYAAKDYYPEGWLNNPYKTPSAVQIMTIHQAKGLEFPAVFIPGLNKNYLPSKKIGGLTEWHFLDPLIISNQSRYTGDEEDERRLFYVAMTRAEKFLFISRAPHATNRLYTRPSIFVDEISRSNVIVSNLPDFSIKPKIAAEPKEEIVSINLNFSVLKDFFDCPYRFKLVSMYGFSFPLDQRMGYGRSMHNSLMELHKRIKLGGEIKKEELESITNRQSHFPYLGTSSILAEMKEKVKANVIEYYDKNKDSLRNIEFVEQEIQLSLDEGVLISGRIDLIKKRLNEEMFETTIIEFKSKSDVQKKKLTIDQLNLYALGHKELTGETADYIQVYDLESKIQDPPILLNEKHLEEIQSNIKGAASSIRKQEFIEKPNKSLCKDCLQRPVCRSGLKFG
jgi:DNA helicase II / ATP-dependent DNA helicase PcrA